MGKTESIIGCKPPSSSSKLRIGEWYSALKKMWGFLGNIAIAIWQQMATRGVGGAHTLAGNCLSRRNISTCGGHKHLAESLGRPGHCGHSTCHAGTPGQGSKNKAFK